VLIDLGFGESPCAVGTALAQQRAPLDPRWDLKLELTSNDDDRSYVALAKAFALAPARSRLLVGPLTDHGRTMDAVNGLCDTMHNLRPAFAAHRALNGILFPEKRAENPAPEFTVTCLKGTLYARSPANRTFGLGLDPAGLDKIPASGASHTLGIYIAANRGIGP